MITPGAGQWKERVKLVPYVALQVSTCVVAKGCVFVSIVCFVLCVSECVCSCLYAGGLRQGGAL